MTNRNEHICPRCGKPFGPTDPKRELCIECHLAALDEQRAKEGPTKIDHTIKGIRRPLNVKAKLLGHSYDDRLTDGFNMTGGCNR